MSSRKMHMVFGEWVGPSRKSEKGNAAGMLYASIENIEKKTSRLVMGTMILSRREIASSFELLDAAIELGYTAFDSAIVYAGGDSERVLGQWMEERGNREEVVIVSKGCHPNADRARVTPADITTDLADSLARLRSDYVDVYLLHRDNPDVPVGPIVETFNEHLRAGRIRAFGGSNWTHQRIAEANRYAEENGLVPFVASSPNYGLAEQVENPWGPGCVTVSGPANQDARDWYRDNRIPVLAYSSLARGLFSGRVTPENYEEMKSTTLDGACKTAYCHPCNIDRLDRAIQLGRKKDLSVPQIVIAYILASDFQVFPIVGAANRTELEQNLRGLETTLTKQECAWLNLETNDPPKNAATT